MREISLREMQLLELELLQELDRFCREQGLTYYLAYGTLLGAVRHGGFIPWDDDVDVWMPRADYDRLIASFQDKKTGTKVPYYHLVGPLDSRSRHSFVKIIDTRTVKKETNFDYATGELGIDIDVFPLDGQPQDQKEYEQWFAALQRCYWRADLPVRLVRDSPKRQWALRIINGLGGTSRWLGTRIKTHYLKQALQLHQKYPYEDSSIIGMAETCFGCENDRFEATDFAKTIDLPFEGYMLKTPAEYEKILSQLYGDYRQLPPVEERRGHQLDAVYWKE